MERKLVHSREVRCLGYLRDDGLWDIEGQLTDRKTYLHDDGHAARREPGDPVHDLSLRMTIDDRYEIREIVPVFTNVPHPDCRGAASAYEGLVGVPIVAGFSRTVRERTGGVKGCTHLTDLLTAMATTAFQTVFGWTHLRTGSGNGLGSAASVAAVINGCRTWRSDGEIVSRICPERFTGPADGPA